MRKEPPNQYRRRDMGPWSSTDEDGFNGAFQIPLTMPDGKRVLANCIVSDGRNVDGTVMVPWEHVSIHIEKNGKQVTPNWRQMCMVKDIFWGPEECVVQYHPPQSEYVNNHRNVLHLWKWTGGEFPAPPSILVGVKQLGELP